MAEEAAGAEMALSEREGDAVGQVRAPWIKRLVALLCVLLPPYVIAVTCPQIFFVALEFSGAFRLILFGILPAVMVRTRATDHPLPPVMWGAHRRDGCYGMYCGN